MGATLLQPDPSSPAGFRRSFCLSTRSAVLSLFLMLAFMAICLITYQWLSAVMQRAKRHKEAVRAIEKAGGWVTWDFCEPGYESHYFDRVVCVNLTRARVTDALLNHLKDLPELKGVFFPDTTTDTQLKFLWGLSQLQELDISGTQITDAGLRNVSRLGTLQQVNLARTKITDAGLEYLKSLKRLRSVQLQQTKVTAKGVKELRKALPRCEVFTDNSPVFRHETDRTS
jgi:hypothetical protein